MKVYIYVLICLQGCSQVVTQPQPLHDGRWGLYNELTAEECAIAAMIAGIDSAEITKMFNKCVFDQGLTI